MADPGNPLADGPLLFKLDSEEAILSESLNSLIIESSKCIDVDLLFNVDSDAKQPAWKLAFLIAIGVKTLIKLVAAIHQRVLLNQDSTLERKYETQLPSKSSDILTLEQLKEILPL